jgi:hypothetical protein
MNNTETIHDAISAGYDLVARMLTEGKRKAASGELNMAAYTALLKQAEDLIIQASALENVLPARSN